MAVLGASKPVEFVATTRRHQITNFLREQIIHGHLKPGEALREAEIASQLGVSRGPLREALRLLVSDGLVVEKPYSGITVATFSANDIADIHHVRAALESKAFELLWAGRDDGFRDEITRRHEALLYAIRHGEADDIVAAEMEFHRYAYERSGSPLLLAIWEQLERKIRLSVLMHLDAFSVTHGYEIAHLKFFEAALGPNLDNMQSELRRHLAEGEENIHRLPRFSESV